MKKLVLAFVAIAAIYFASCGDKKTASNTGADTTNVDSTLNDSVANDSAATDSAARM